MTVKLSAANQEYLIEGLKAAGFQVHKRGDSISVTKGWRSALIRNGEVEADESYAQEIANEIKRAYSAENVRRQASAYGWHITGDLLSDQGITLERRY